MKTIFSILIKSLIALLVLVVLLGVGLNTLINQPAGQAWLSETASQLSDGKFVVRDLRGHLPGVLEAGEIRLADTHGEWLSIEHFRLHWTMHELWKGAIEIQQLAAQRLKLKPQDNPNFTFQPEAFNLPLPAGLTLKVLDFHIDNLQLDNMDQTIALQGQLQIASERQFNIHLTAEKQDQDVWQLSIATDSDHLQIGLRMHEQGHGLLSQQLKTDALPNSELELDMDGNWRQAQIHGSLAAGNPPTLLLNLTGSVALQPDPYLDLDISLPELKNLSAWSGLALQGSAHNQLHILRQKQALQIEANGELNLAHSEPDIEKLVGKQPRYAASLELNGADLQIKRFALFNAPLQVQCSGSFAAGIAHLDWLTELAQVDKFIPAVKAALAVKGRLDGDINALTVQAIATLKPQHPGSFLQGLSPVKFELALQKTATFGGTLHSHADFDGAPLDAQLQFLQQAGNWSVNLDHLNWRSSHFAGQLHLPSGPLPFSTKINATVGRLQDYKSLLGNAVSGSLSADLTNCAGSSAWCVHALGKQIGLGSALLDEIELNGKLTGQHIQADLLMRHAVVANLNADAQLQVNGTTDHLDMHLSGQLQTPQQHSIQVDSRAQLLTTAQRLRVLALTAKEITPANTPGLLMTLQQPADIQLAPTLDISNTSLGFASGVVTLNGRLAPTMNFQATAHDFDLARIATLIPDYPLQGTLQATLQVQGNPAHPEGNVSVSLKDLHASNPALQAFPAVQMQANANFANDQADISAQLNLDAHNTVTVTGIVPLLSAKNSDLKLSGVLDLNILNRKLMAEGRQLAGRLTLDSTLSGALELQNLNGALELTDGDFKDYRFGSHVSGLNSKIRVENGKARIVGLTGKIGAGDFKVSGAMDLQQPAGLIDLQAHLKDAQLFSSDHLTLNLNADLALQGTTTAAPTLSGSVFLNRTDIRIPERLPTKIAVLQFRQPAGQAPPPVPAAPFWQAIRLNMLVAAPHEIFVRGRGVNAVLGGNIKLTGSLQAPISNGAFRLQRGDYSLAGRTLTFSSGTIHFDGNSMTDPVLNLVAGVTNATAASTLTIAGHASKPEIVLQSVPPLPQEEILAQILFDGSISKLSPLEMAQMAAAVTTMSGAGSTITNAVDKVRQALGLDRLSVGSNAQGATLEAGRYVLPGLYLGAQQGLSGAGGSQGVVQMDLTEHLKLQGSFGIAGQSANTGGNSTGASKAGVVYQMEY